MKKSSLITVSGMSPAIITETVWALAIEEQPTVPDDVIVITTSQGESDITDQLLSPRDDWGGRTVWESLRADVFQRTGLPADCEKLQIAIRVIELPDAVSGQRRKADDIRTNFDNAAAADFMVQCLAPFVDDADNHVVASIAGGRKTMGALLYGAMTLIGNEGDRVTHVLVGEPFEYCRGFFYPAQPVQALTAKPFGQEPIEIAAADAEVDLADLMFVPLRNRFAELNELRRSFTGLVEHYSLSQMSSLNRPPLVELDTDDATLTVNGTPIKVTGRNLVITSFLYQRAIRGEKHFARRDENMIPQLNEYLDQWREQPSAHESTNQLTQQFDRDDVTRCLSHIRTHLRDAGLEKSADYLVPERSRIGFEISRKEG